ncbi:H-type lectin domain-containing protein [Salinispora cortesiana]|uniref:H-type lectin domain-containing protein n=1 Tax=Salinispora cortesiana TaxID=1305843 RepID=UPI000470423D|nr:H-type lectin domain-containing protein [Salinispora cortesiana]
MTHWQSGMLITPARLGEQESGQVDVSFTNLALYTQPVAFAEPFAATPRVTTQIVSGAGPTARWGSRPINITTTGFTLFVFRGDGVSPGSTWDDIPVQWIAVLEGTS